MNEIKPDLILKIIDGPSFAPNFKRTIRVHRRSDVPGAWNCTDFLTGEVLTIQESKLLMFLNEQQNGEKQS